jgi:hypothetical protein
LKGFCGNLTRSGFKKILGDTVKMFPKALKILTGPARQKGLRDSERCGK